MRGFEELEAMLDREADVAAELDAVVSRFAEKNEITLREALTKTGEIARKFGKNEYSLDLLLIVNSLPFLHARYRERNIPDSVFCASMDDIRCKVAECVECKGVVGTFVAGWYDRFFDMTRFAYGRFQYEDVTYDGEIVKFGCGKTLKNGDVFVNMHIPSSGIPLTDEVRLASYREAYKHFKNRFEDGIVIFGCSSWLLYTRHREFLPENSNILKFMDDFEKIKRFDTDRFHDAWRVFGRFAELPAEKLPRDTSLRRAYADWLAAGEKTGEGFGLFAFDGENILR
ncbi:MAG: DUF5596 domain-containing protein [Clostridia bacterium]|nr:DUF5596 domain-containing protein [Clostridia bacterium]